jgi:hypothetical protein
MVFRDRDGTIEVPADDIRSILPDALTESQEMEAPVFLREGLEMKIQKTQSSGFDDLEIAIQVEGVHEG